MLEKLLSRFGYIRAEEARGPAFLAASLTSLLNGAPRPSVHNAKEYLGRYADQAWVYACVSVIASKGGGVPLCIFKKDDAEADAEKVPDHPLQKLLDSVNPFMNQFDLLESTLGFLGLAGNHYWLLDAFQDGKPTEIYPLNPARIKINGDKKKYIRSFTYESAPGVDKAEFPPEVILHFKTWNPLDDFYGLAPISAARDASDAMMSADRYNRAFFENAAEPGGILTTEGTLMETTRDRIERAWRSLHQGERKAHRVGILEGGLKWQTTSASHKDMQFPELKRMSREDVLAVYRLPPIMVGVFDEANYSNAREQRAIFWADTMIPWLSKLKSVINERLVKPYDAGVFADFDLSGVEELHENRKVAAEEDEILTRSGILTINEAREKRKLPPVSWGDTWNAPMGVGPIDGPRALPPAPPGGPGPDEEEAEPEEESKTARAAQELAQVIREADEKKAAAKAEAEKAEQEKAQKAFLRRTAIWTEFKGFTETWESR